MPHREAESQLPPDLALLLGALRSEFNAELSSLKAWGGVALLAGGTIGGLVSTLIGPRVAGQSVQTAFAVVASLF